MLREDKTPDIDVREDDAPLAPSRTSAHDGFDDMEGWFEELRRDLFRAGPIAMLPEAVPGRFPVREPRVDLVDTGREFLIRTELPSIAKDDVDLTVTSDGLDIRTESKDQREEDAEGYYVRERRHSAAHRRLPFPAEAVPDRAVAFLKDGLLEVRVPKREPTPTTDPVKVRAD